MPHATEKDGMWVDRDGMTLYTFDKDAGGKSMINGEAAVHWPPLLVHPDDAPAGGQWTRIVRDGGETQWAYDGKPLYTFAKDKKPGDTTGDGVKDAFHVAKP